MRRGRGDERSFASTRAYHTPVKILRALQAVLLDALRIRAARKPWALTRMLVGVKAFQRDQQET